MEKLKIIIYIFYGVFVLLYAVKFDKSYRNDSIKDLILYGVLLILITIGVSNI